MMVVVSCLASPPNRRAGELRNCVGFSIGGGASRGEV